MIESKVKNLFSNKDFTSQLLRNHFSYHGNFRIINELKFENGLTVDHAIFDKDDKILGLIESKGTIGTTEFVRGIGQAFQYSEFIKNGKSYDYSNLAKSVLAFPDDLQKNISIEKFSYPKENKELLG